VLHFDGTETLLQVDLNHERSDLYFEWVDIKRFAGVIQTDFGMVALHEEDRMVSVEYQESLACDLSRVVEQKEEFFGAGVVEEVAVFDRSSEARDAGFGEVPQQLADAVVWLGHEGLAEFSEGHVDEQLVWPRTGAAVRGSWQSAGGGPVCRVEGQLGSKRLGREVESGCWFLGVWCGDAFFYLSLAWGWMEMRVGVFAVLGWSRFFFEVGFGVWGWGRAGDAGTLGVF